MVHQTGKDIYLKFWKLSNFKHMAGIQRLRFPRVLARGPLLWISVCKN